MSILYLCLPGMSITFQMTIASQFPQRNIYVEGKTKFIKIGVGGLNPPQEKCIANLTEKGLWLIVLS